MAGADKDIFAFAALPYLSAVACVVPRLLQHLFS
jgi:hypothetical protein